MRTSYQQYAVMVEFMEKHGDLSKPGGGPRGRHFIQQKWKDLCEKLNSDGSGDSRPEEKWRKVWSDFNNNCKKKLAKINRAAGGTGGGPALQLSLTDLESRVIQIIGVQAATGMEVEEAGFLQTAEDSNQAVKETISNEPYDIDWNTPGTSSQPTVVAPINKTIVEPLSEPSVVPPQSPINVAPTSPGPSEEQWKPAPKKMKKENVAKLFVQRERNSREYARERDRIYEQLERERLRQHDEELRLRELELRERVRQRDVELQLQSQWQELIRQALNIIERHFGRNDTND